MRPIETSARALADAHAVVLLDAYGVLVDGQGAIEGAPEFIRDLELAGQPYLVVTNDASKRPEEGSRRYRGFGLELAPERIVTSGSLLQAYFRDEGLVGLQTMVLGTPDSVSFATEAGAAVVALTEPDAEVIVIADEAGYPFLETLDHVLSVILRRLDRGDPIRLVLPNPDLIYPKSPGEFGIAAGSIAQTIEAAIDLRFPTDHRRPRFARLGKPFAAIFAEAERRAGTKDMVMIGDQLATDIRGARSYGLSAGLVTWGVSGSVPDDLPADQAPTHLVTQF